MRSGESGGDGVGAVQRTGTNQPLTAGSPACLTHFGGGGGGRRDRSGATHRHRALRARPPRLTHFGAGEQHRALGLADIVTLAGHVALVHPELGEEMEGQISTVLSPQ